MKNYWMKPVTVVAEKQTISSAKTSQIIANEVQREAIFALERHVFGSKDGYFKWRESGKPFPPEYKTAKNFILNYPWGNEEFFNAFIQMIPKAQIISESVNSTIDSEESIVETKAPSISVDAFLAECIRMDGKRGTRRRGTFRDPLIYENYVKRAREVQSRARSTNYNESMVSEIIVQYTERYNEKFETSFEVYHSKKIYSKKRDGERV